MIARDVSSFHHNFHPTQTLAFFTCCCSWFFLAFLTTKITFLRTLPLQHRHTYHLASPSTAIFPKLFQWWCNTFEVIDVSGSMMGEYLKLLFVFFFVLIYSDRTMRCILPLSDRYPPMVFILRMSFLFFISFFSHVFLMLFFPLFSRVFFCPRPIVLTHFFSPTISTRLHSSITSHTNNNPSTTAISSHPNKASSLLLQVDLPPPFCQSRWLFETLSPTVILLALSQLRILSF